MRKLKLDVDALQVDSLEMHAPAAAAGTVHGRFNQVEESTDCDGAGWGSLFGTCDGCPTVGTCVGPTYCCPPTWRPSCEPTCHYTDCTDPCGL